MNGGALLEVRDVSKRFGGLLALNRVDLAIEAGQLHALIGPNGAGKTTMANVISGLTSATEGRVAFRGQDITRARADQICASGMSRTFQNLRCFPTMTALENVMVGRHRLDRTSTWSTFFRLPFASAATEVRCRERSHELLNLVGLGPRADSPAGSLALAEQRLLEIARALATEPVMLLLDEPTAGMGSGETGLVRELILAVAERGTTILLIAHDMNLVMAIATRVTVLNQGEKIAEGLPSEVREDPGVEEAYLGVDAD